MRRRVGRRARDEGRKARRAHLAAVWPVLVLFGVTMGLLTATFLVFLDRWYGRNFLFFAAGAATFGIGVGLWQLTLTPSIRTWFDGAEGERLTAAVLRRLRLSHWRAVHNIEFAVDDVDHVVAGPGVVFSIETKWVNHPWTAREGELSDPRVLRAIDQARRSARRTSQLLKGNYRLHLEVRPVVAVWGPGRPTSPGPIEVDGVTVMPGEQLRRWLEGVQRHALNQRSVVRALRHFTRVREEHDRRCPDRRTCHCPVVPPDWP